MSKQILLPTSVISELKKTFKTSRVTLWNALTFKTDSSFARALREAARQRGGLLYTGVVPAGFIADCETDFDTAGRKITQKFGNGLTIVSDQANNTATVMVDGRSVITIPGMTVGMWNQLLYGIQEIVSELN